MVKKIENIGVFKINQFNCYKQFAVLKYHFFHNLLLKILLS